MTRERLSKASTVVRLSQLCSDRSSIACTRHSMCHAAVRGPPRFLLALSGCGGGRVSGVGGRSGGGWGWCGAALSLLTAHLSHFVSDCIHLGPSPVVFAGGCRASVFGSCPKAMSIHKRLLGAKRERLLSYYTGLKMAGCHHLFPAIIPGKCLHALSHQLPVMYKNAWKRNIWSLWF